MRKWAAPKKIFRYMVVPSATTRRLKQGGKEKTLSHQIA